MNNLCNGPMCLPDEAIAEIEAEARRRYDEYAEECSRPKLTTLGWLAARMRGYALNEITGDIAMTDGNGGSKIVLQGTSASGRCSLLFDSESVDRSWAPISDTEARDRCLRHALL